MVLLTQLKAIEENIVKLCVEHVLEGVGNGIRTHILQIESAIVAHPHLILGAKRLKCIIVVERRLVFLNWRQGLRLLIGILRSTNSLIQGLNSIITLTRLGVCHFLLFLFRFQVFGHCISIYRSFLLLFRRENTQDLRLQGSKLPTKP